MSQREGALSFAAAGTPLASGPTERISPSASKGAGLALVGARAAAGQSSQTPPAASCKQCLTISIFFDGTGNNLEADVGTLQHSNIARLYQSALSDDIAVGRHRIYVPGLGTYFKEIGDPGHTTRGLGMGAMGQDRLDWAFKKLDEIVKKAEARALNPTNKILFIKLSVFGFSRGATAARAFVRDMALRCEHCQGQYRLKAGGYPVEVMFLGLFDTVASVGVPMSGNNTPGATSAGWYGLRTTMGVRNVIDMAFGEPGADPAPGDFDGHASWADGLRVPAPDFVKRCVHMVAGHEVRNSFPVDSTLDGTRYPGAVSEFVYPGVHSDVGGGYQPGEGARSEHPGQMLSLIPLRAMHEKARQAGVPLDSLQGLAGRSDVIRRSFALDDEGTKHFNEMSRLFSVYVNKAGSGRPIGTEILSHSSWWLRWRFFNMRRIEAAVRSGKAGPDDEVIGQREPRFAAERARQQATVNSLEQQWQRDRTAADRAEQRYQSAQMAQARYGLPLDPALAQARSATAAREAASRDAHLREKAKLDTSADDSALRANLAAYNERLLQDAQTIVAHHKQNPTLKLRPHYANLVEAYRAQYLGREPLHPDVVGFFDHHVHDSLAGFAQDATLPSDPRVVYAGGDNKIRFAQLDLPVSESEVRAA
jgi:Uncharacterized alpha/beta hydrolase domain (DUF2235)